MADIPAYAREPNRLRVDWTTIADPRRRLCAKEVGLALLQPQLGLDRRLGAARRRRLPPHVLVTQLHRWRLWFDWLQRHHVARLADVTQAHCDAWLAERRGQVGLTALRAEVINLRLFADYRQILTADAYREGFRPWAATDASTVTGRPPAARTPPRSYPTKSSRPCSPPPSSWSRWPGPTSSRLAPNGASCSSRPVKAERSTSVSSSTWQPCAARGVACPNCTTSR